MTKQDITWHHEPLTLEHKYGEANEWLQTIIITILYKGLKGTVINKKNYFELRFEQLLMNINIVALKWMIFVCFRIFFKILKSAFTNLAL